MGSQPVRWPTVAAPLPSRMLHHQGQEPAPMTEPGCSERRVKRAWIQHPALDHR